MPEAIDRAKVLEYLTPRIKTKTPYGEGYNRALEDAAELVALMPTIDPEVRHGRWECGGFCSECGLDNEERKTDYCPNCGARMDATITNVGGKGGDDNG